MSKTEATQKKEFTMKEVFALWVKQGKNGTMYLSGKDSTGQFLTGFFNGKKQNPKEPDIRIYTNTDEGISKEEYTSLWCNVSKNGNKYFTGKMGGIRITGFINKKAEVGSKIPYITVYFQAEETEAKQETIKEAETMSTTEPVKQEKLPF